MQFKGIPHTVIRRLLLALVLLATPALLHAGQPTALTFQGRLHDVSVINIAPNVIVPNAGDLIFVKTADAKKFLCLPAGTQRGDYDPVNQRFYMLDLVDGDIFGFSQIDGTLINLDGTFFSALNQDAIPSEIINRPISIPSTEIATDIAIVDNQRIGYRTDGPSNLDINLNPIEDEKVYVLTRAGAAVIEAPTLTVPLKDADLPQNVSVFLEWDAFNQTFLFIQNQLDGARTRNTDLRDRLNAIARDGTVNGTVFFTTDAINTPDAFFPTYSGNAGGVALDPETNIVYIVDPAQRQIFVLTPRQTEIITIVPPRGPAAGGTSVTLNGNNFPSDAQVFFDGIAATNVVVVSTTQITAVTPAHALGPVNVTLTGTGIPVATPVTVVGGFIYENTPPIAVLQASPSRGPAPLSVNFNIAGVNDPDGTVVSRVINFDDGQTFTFPPNLAVITTSHTYGAEGTYNAILTVTDNLGGSSTANKLIVVGDDLPLVVRSLSIKTEQSDAEISRDTMTLKGEFVLPEDLDITDAQISVGFALPSAPALGVYSAGEEPEFQENVNGGQYDGELVPTKNGKTGKLPGKLVKFTYKPFKRPGVTPSTYTFSFSGKGSELFSALEKSLVTAEGAAIDFDTQTTPILATFTVIVRVAAGADILNFKKQTVVELKPSKSKSFTLKRR